MHWPLSPPSLSCFHAHSKSLLKYVVQTDASVYRLCLCLFFVNFQWKFCPTSPLFSIPTRALFSTTATEPPCVVFQWRQAPHAVACIFVDRPPLPLSPSPPLPIRLSLYLTPSCSDLTHSNTQCLHVDGPLFFLLPSLPPYLPTCTWISY